MTTSGPTDPRNITGPSSTGPVGPAHHADEIRRKAIELSKDTMSSAEAKGPDLTAPRVSRKPGLAPPQPTNATYEQKEVYKILAKAFCSLLEDATRAIQTASADFSASSASTNTDIQVSVKDAVTAVQKQEHAQKVAHEIKEKMKKTEFATKFLNYLMIAVTVVVIAIACIPTGGGAGAALVPTVTAETAAIEGGTVAADVAVETSALAAQGAESGTAAVAETSIDDAIAAAEVGTDATAGGTTGSTAAAGGAEETAGEAVADVAEEGTSGSSAALGTTEEGVADTTSEESSKSAIEAIQSMKLWFKGLTGAQKLLVATSMSVVMSSPMLVGGLSDQAKAEMQKRLANQQEQLAPLMARLAEDQGQMKWIQQVLQRESKVIQELTAQAPDALKVFSEIFNQLVEATSASKHA